MGRKVIMNERLANYIRLAVDVAKGRIDNIVADEPFLWVDTLCGAMGEYQADILRLEKQILRIEKSIEDRKALIYNLRLEVGRQRLPNLSKTPTGVTMKTKYFTISVNDLTDNITIKNLKPKKVRGNK